MAEFKKICEAKFLPFYISSNSTCCLHWKVSKICGFFPPSSSRVVKSKTGISPSPGDCSPSLTPSWLNSSHNIFQIAHISQSWNKVTFTKQLENLVLIHNRGSQRFDHVPKQKIVCMYIFWAVLLRFLVNMIIHEPLSQEVPWCFICMLSPRYFWPW